MPTELGYREASQQGALLAGVKTDRGLVAASVWRGLAVVPPDAVSPPLLTASSDDFVVSSRAYDRALGNGSAGSARRNLRHHLR